MSELDAIGMLRAAAQRVRDPISGKSVLLADMIIDARVTESGVTAEVSFAAEHTPHDRKGIAAAVEANMRSMGFDGSLLVLPVGATPRPETPRPESPAKKPSGASIPGLQGKGMTPHGGPVNKRDIGVKRLIAVASGKGGVGKSTIACNLAIALRQAGYSVGLLDADIYGPSAHVMMNVQVKPMITPERKILPVNAYGVRCLSMGMLVDEDQAMIWRGPMVQGAVRQFLQDAEWGGLDYLIVDLPPGTGEVQLTLIQGVEIHGAVIVTTPQKVALADAVRGITMFEKLDVPILGLVENMAWYELPDGTRDPVFGEGGGVRIAERYETDVLGQIPLQSSIRKGGDQGLPAALDRDGVADRFREIAAQVAEKLPVGE